MGSLGIPCVRKSYCLGLFNSRSFFALGCDADNHPVVWSFVQSSSSQRWRSGPLSRRSPVSRDTVWLPLFIIFNVISLWFNASRVYDALLFGDFLESFQHEGWYTQSATCQVRTNQSIMRSVRCGLPSRPSIAHFWFIIICLKFILMLMSNISWKWAVPR